MRSIEPQPRELKVLEIELENRLKSLTIRKAEKLVADYCEVLIIIHNDVVLEVEKAQGLIPSFFDMIYPLF